MTVRLGPTGERPAAARRAALESGATAPGGQIQRRAGPPQGRASRSNLRDCGGNDRLGGRPPVGRPTENIAGIRDHPLSDLIVELLLTRRVCVTLEGLWATWPDRSGSPPVRTESATRPQTAHSGHRQSTIKSQIRGGIQLYSKAVESGSTFPGVQADSSGARLACAFAQEAVWVAP